MTHHDREYNKLWRQTRDAWEGRGPKCVRPPPDPLRVGDLLDGFCAGAFGREYADKRVEAIGADWVVARDVETGKVHFADVGPGELVGFRKG